MHTATQENQRSDRSTSEGGGRDKLKKVDGDFPTCMRHERDNNDDNTRKNEDLKGKEEEDSNTTTSMEICHCV